jgi:hypothetical protein
MWNKVVGLLLFLFVLSVFDLLVDPYFHRERVNFWTWLKRELIEEVEGEKE